MKQLIAFLLIFALFSCKHAKYNSEAIKLNDSAVAIMRNPITNQKQALSDAIVLLNKATEIDSNYITGYSNKLNFQIDLKNYNDAIITGNKLIRLMPDAGLWKSTVGEVYERMGDTITSKKYYTQALSVFDITSTKLNYNGKSYRSDQYQKACVLMLLDRKQDANAILKKLAESETDNYLKKQYAETINKSRNELIYGKQTEISTIQGVTSTITTINGKFDTVITKP